MDALVNKNVMSIIKNTLQLEKEELQEAIKIQTDTPEEAMAMMKILKNGFNGYGAACAAVRFLDKL